VSPASPTANLGKLRKATPKKKGHEKVEERETWKQRAEAHEGVE